MERGRLVVVAIVAVIISACSKPTDDPTHCPDGSIDPRAICDGCGNGAVGGTEECDDHNAVEGDGCSSTCTIESGWCCIDRTTCVAADAHPTGVPCLVCAPTLTNTTWSATGAIACDDGVYCNGTDTCSGGMCSTHAGLSCTGGTPYCSETAKGCFECTEAAHCDDGNDCTTDSCDAGVCAHVNNTGPCDDGVYCNGADACSGGSCSVHAGMPCSGDTVYCVEAQKTCAGCTDASQCNDSNPCTDDSCSNGTCAHANNTAACNDGVYSNGAQTCSGGSCSVHGAN